MKTCPKCRITLDAHCECPLCHADLTNEPYAQTESEKYAFNKYLLIYIAKFAKFFLTCTILSFIGVIIKLPSFSLLYIVSLICLLICFCETFFPSRFNSMWQAVYSENYLEATKKLTKYVSGVLAIVIISVFQLLILSKATENRCYF